MIPLKQQPRINIKLGVIPINVPLSTPAILGYVAFLIAFFTCFASYREHIATAELANTVKTIGKDCVPSIIAAQEVSMELADLNCQNITTRIVTGDSLEMTRAKMMILQRNQEIALTLVNTAENITLGDDERKPIISIVQSLTEYQSFMTEATIYNQQSMMAADPETKDQKKKLSLESALNGYNVMHQKILPAAVTLDKIKNDELETTYQAYTQDSTERNSILITLGLLVIFIGFQIYLTIKTHRIVNGPLALATLLTIVYLTANTTILWNQKSQLKSAIFDAFGSLHPLWAARAVAYNANAEERRWLYDLDNKDTYEKSFFDKMNLLIPITKGENVDSYIENPGNTPGYLLDEIRNITYPGEKEAAETTINSLAKYIAVDKKVRDLENNGKHDDAIALCLSYDPTGGCQFLFSQFDTVLGQTIEINQQAFDQDINQSTTLLNSLWWMHLGFAVITCALIACGILPRIEEFKK